MKRFIRNNGVLVVAFVLMASFTGALLVTVPVVNHFGAGISTYVQIALELGLPLLFAFGVTCGVQKKFGIRMDMPKHSRNWKIPLMEYPKNYRLSTQ